MIAPKNIQGEIEKYLSKKNVYFGNFSNELVTFLEINFPHVNTIRAKWYMFVHGMNELPICLYPSCETSVKWNEGLKKFSDGCCIDHNKKITSLKNFGVDHPNKSKKQQRKVKKSMQEKYGVDYITQTDIHKTSVMHSVMESYGVDNVLKSPKIREKIRKTNLEKYGVEECISAPIIREKSKQTNLKKFGTECSLSSVEVREKAYKTNLFRYGSIFPMRNEELLEKRLQTIIGRYDSHGVLGDKNIADKARKTHFAKYYNNKLLKNKFVSPLFTLDEYQGTKRVKDYSWECKKCYTEFIDNVDNGHLPRCPTCFPKDIKVSNDESLLFSLINVKNKLQTNRGLIPNYEIDIYLPDYKTGIEYNGMFWHSEKMGVDQFYHLDKTLMSENSGIFLIHIFESEWVKRRLQTIGMVHRNIGIFDIIISIQDIEIKEISDIITNDFLEANTIHLFDSVSEKRIGAYHGLELVAIMTTKQFKNKTVITKFYEKMGYGFEGNLFQKMVNNFDNSLPIFYYPDRRYNKVDQQFLLDCGFTFEGGTEPELIYSRNMSYIPANHINKHNILNYVTDYDDKLSVYENMIVNGYLTIWDCGKLVWKKS
jgi:hypothetical protein